MISVFLFLLVFPFFSQADSCADWFNKTNISPVDKNCKSLCRVSQSDMSTFSCNQQCDEFCQDPCKKKLNELEKFISHSKPKVWRDTEKLTPWKKIEKN